MPKTYFPTHWLRPRSETHERLSKQQSQERWGWLGSTCRLCLESGTQARFQDLWCTISSTRKCELPVREQQQNRVFFRPLRISSTRKYELPGLSDHTVPALTKDETLTFAPPTHLYPNAPLPYTPATTPIPQYRPHPCRLALVCLILRGWSSWFFLTWIRVCL